jgi:hypothetical protein
MAVVDRGEENGAIVGDGVETGLEGAELAAVGVVIEYNPGGGEKAAGGECGVKAGPEDDDYLLADLGKDMDEAVEVGFAVPQKECFGETHAAGETGGEDDPVHCNSARRESLQKTDLE